MKLLKRIMLLGIFSIIVLAVFSKVNAASASISSDKKSMTVGEKATITVKYNAAAWNIQVSGAVSYSDADASSDAKNISKSTKLSFKPTKAGTYSISLSGDVTDGTTGKTKDLSDSIKIEVKQKEKEPEPTLSSDATLKNLGITPSKYDFTGFKKATTAYSVTVPNDAKTISIYATPTDTKATASGTGSKTLKVGKNTYSIKVTAEDKKTTKTYTLTITRKEKDEESAETEPVVSTDATLRNLGITPSKYDFSGFKKATTSYEVEVPNDAETISIYAAPTDTKAKVSGTGTQTLKEGKNTYEVKVTAEDGKTTNIYTLTITRKEKQEEAEEPEEDPDKEPEMEAEEPTETTVAGIKNIEIEKYTLSPSFNQEVYDYTVNVTDEIKKLDIKTEATSDDIEVEIVGNENLKTGKNTITILARDIKSDATTTYQITATVGEEEIDLTKINYEIEQYQASIKKQEWIVKGTIVLIICLIVVFLIQKYRLEKENGQIYEYEEDSYEQEDVESSDSENIDEQEMSVKQGRFVEPEEFEEMKRTGRYKGRRFK